MATAENQTKAEDQMSYEANSFKDALGDVINVNALFTSAVFIGLAFSGSTGTLETREECKADAGIAKQLVTFEIIAFGFLLTSSLVGKALKIQLYIIKKNSDVIQNVCRMMMVICFACSICGSFFLFFSIINVLQMRLGKLTCMGTVWVPAGFLIFLYFLAFLFWVPTLVYVQYLSWDLDF